MFVITAVALFAAAGTMYLTQRSFLLERVDDQTASALPVLELRLDCETGMVGLRDEARCRRVRGLIGGGSGSTTADGASGRAGAGGAGIVLRDLTPRDGDRRPGGPPGGGPGTLPESAYGERRTVRGTVLGRTTFTSPFAEDDPPHPRLPDDLRPGQRLSVGSGSGGPRYRVRVSDGGPDGTLTVVAVPQTSVDDALDRLLLVAGLVIVLALVLLAASAWWIVRLGLRPLDRMAATAGAIAGGDLSHRVEEESPRSEVGRLGRALNAMLTRLEQAFAERAAGEQRLRRFLSDASHELRTPLASIRGYAELYRVGAIGSDEDLRRAVGRIEDESARMGRLVDDMLVLARLDETRERTVDPVDLAVLTEDAADDARAVAPGRTVTATATGDTVVAGDEGDLRQVVGNLVRNAVVHTPAGTPIELTVEGEDGHVRIEVRDHGPGLPDGRAEELFDRFWRREGGRSRGAGGAGLGLAIVAAVVAAHRGEVSAADAPGGGASFVVRLPRGDR
ncbi:MAG: sensor histidine kinase [Solirubrobacteraceae bacterium]